MTMTKLNAGLTLVLGLSVLTGRGPEARAQHQNRTDQFGDPLPAGAIARLGTVRWCLDAFPHCMVVSQDGKVLLSANPDTGISAWDLATGRITRQFPVGRELRKKCLPGSALALSADGRTAALAGPEGTVCILDLDTGKEKQLCRGHRGAVEEAALSADGRVLATRSVDETLRVWDAVTGEQLRQMPIHRLTPFQSRPVELALSPDGKTLAWVGERNKRLIHVCEAVSGRELHRLSEQKGDRHGIAFSPDGQKLLATGDLGPGQIWDLKTGRVIRELPFWKKFWRASTAFTPDCKAVVLTLGGDADGAMRLIEVATGKELWRVPRPLSSTILDEFAFTPEGKTLIVSSHAMGRVIYRYEVATGKRLVSPIEPNAGFEALAFSTNEQILYSLGADGELRSWEATTGKELAHTLIGTPRGLFAPGGRLLAANKGGTLHLYEPATGKEVRQLAGGHPWCFSANGQVLAALGQDEGNNGTVILYEVTTGKEIRRLPKPTEYLHQIASTADGNSLVCQTWTGDFARGGPLYFWDLSNGRRLRIMNLPDNWGTVPLSPDGKTLAVPLRNWKSIDFLEVTTGQKRLEIEPPAQWPSALDFSPDGRLFLVSQPDGSVKFYHAYTGRLLLRREGHRGMVADWAFSASGRKMATLSADRTVLVWDISDLRAAENKEPITLSHKELSGLWSDLGGKDAVKAYQAIHKLARAPEQAVAWLEEHLQPIAPADSKRLHRLIVDLDSARFEVRQQVAAEIEKHGDLARPAIEKALAGKPTVEVRRRLEQLLEGFDVSKSPETLRHLRAVEVLERIGNPEAHEVLENLTKGSPDARLTKEAKASLIRLANRD